MRVPLCLSVCLSSLLSLSVCLSVCLYLSLSLSLSLSAYLTPDFFPNAFPRGAGSDVCVCVRVRAFPPPTNAYYFPLQVLEVLASRRRGPLNYMACIRHALNRHYGTKPVGVGGAFLIERGKAMLHVMVRVRVSRRTREVS